MRYIVEDRQFDEIAEALLYASEIYKTQGVIVAVIDSYTTKGKTMSNKSKQYYFFVEQTDLFGGEANYAWVNRFKVLATCPKHALTKVKKEVYNNPSKVRHRYNTIHDGLEVRFSGIQHVMHIYTYDYAWHSDMLFVKEI